MTSSGAAELRRLVADASAPDLSNGVTPIVRVPRPSGGSYAVVVRHIASVIPSFAERYLSTALFEGIGLE